MSAEKWITALNYVQQFRTQLETWGITQDFLIAVAAVSSIVFLLSLREVAGWLLRVPHMRQEIKSLRQQVNDMHKTLNEVNEKILARAMSEEEDEVKTEAEPQSAGRPQFRLDH